MKIDISHIEKIDTAILYIYKGKKTYTAEFTSLKKAEEFCEEVLNRIDYKVTRINLTSEKPTLKSIGSPCWWCPYYNTT